MVKEKNTEALETGAVMLRSQAAVEVKSWLDYKKISDAKRLACQIHIIRITKAISFGRLILDPDTKVFKMVLQFPIGKEEVIKELKFKPRLTYDDTKDHLSGAGNDEARTVAFIAACTGEAAGVIGKLDQEDLHLASDLVIFFQIAG